MRYSVTKFNEADKVISQFTWRTFEICELFKNDALKSFWNHVTFNRFKVYEVTRIVRTVFDLGPGAGWAYVSFPVKLMNMDDEKILVNMKQSSMMMAVVIQLISRSQKRRNKYEHDCECRFFS